MTVKAFGTWLLLILGLACAPALARSGRSLDRELILMGEIDALNAANAHEVIQKVRPNFLSYRGETSISNSRSDPYPNIYVDGIAYGPVGTLRTIPATHIATIRLYRSWEATTRFGLGNMSGVIEITTKR